MTSELDSTARVLAATTSPPPASSRRSLGRADTRWNRRRASSSHPQEPIPYAGSGQTLKGKIYLVAERFMQQGYNIFMSLNWWQRLLALLAVIVSTIGGILFLIYSKTVFHWLGPVGESWRALPAGWLIVFVMIFICAFPPMIGFSTSLTIAGFVYGIPIGWLIAATATVLGSLCSFIVSRTILSSYVHRLIASDRRFAAFALTLKHDGLKLLIMIRFCPLPYSLSNGALSTVPTVHPLMFALATAASTPKLLIHLFVGRQLAKIAESGEKMSIATTVVNYAGIAGGMVLGITVGWLIYGKTVARAKELEAEERAHARESGAAPDDRTGSFSDDPDDGPSADHPRDDDISLFENDPDGFDYRDEFTDDEDVFRPGGGDEEETVGMVADVPSKPLLKR